MKNAIFMGDFVTGSGVEVTHAHVSINPSVEGARWGALAQSVLLSFTWIYT